MSVSDSTFEPSLPEEEIQNQTEQAPENAEDVETTEAYLDTAQEENNQIEASHYDYILNWMITRLKLMDFSDAILSKESSQSSIIEFITGLGPKTLSIVRNSDKSYTLICDEINRGIINRGLVAYFIRPSNNSLSQENISKEVQYGTIGKSGLSIQSIEILMKGLVENHISQNNELTGYYHKCMATLTDAVHYSDGRTVLYCPNFEYSSVSEAAQGMNFFHFY